jgi:hypothetical protein
VSADLSESEPVSSGSQASATGHPDRTGGAAQPGGPGGDPQLNASDFGANQWLVDELYQRYLADPGSVDQAWWSFFSDYRSAGSDDDDFADLDGNGSAPAPAVNGSANGSTAPAAPAAPAAPTGAADPVSRLAPLFVPPASDQAAGPSALSKATSAVRGRRAARKPRLAMSAVFADLVDMADIPRSAYAVDEEVTGAMCLFKTDGGYEVFSCAEDARHEVRFFEEEEAAYFYLFGVLAAEALRNGRLSPGRG